MQQDALRRVRETSEAFHNAQRELADVLHAPRRRYQMEEAHWHLLRAQTSCNFFWGEAWVQRCHDDLDVTWFNLDEARK
jgi:hypothetical protein